MATKWRKLNFIPGPNKGRYPFCHSLFLDDDVKVLVDPACDPEVLKKIAEEKRVEVILLSHYHEDHWTFMHLFPHAKIYIHEADAPPMTSIEALFDFYGMEWDSDEGQRYREQLGKFFHYTPKPPDKILQDGDVLEFGTTHVEVIHTPGHCPGHCCFYFKEQDVLFLADYDLTKFGPWYGDRLSDMDEFIESSKKVRYHRAYYKVCAHEVGVAEGDVEELWRHYLGVIDLRQKLIEEALQEGPKSMEELIKERIIYRKAREPQSFFDFGERAHLTKHLEKMLQANKVVLKDEKYHLL